MRFVSPTWAWWHGRIGAVTKSGSLAAALVVGSCAELPAARAPSPLPDGVAFRYEVTVAPDYTLDVEATLRGPIEGQLEVDEPAMRFLEGLSLVDAGGGHPLAPRDPGVASACEAGCRLRYRFRLREAATTLADVDTAMSAGGAVFATPSTFLLRPSVAPSAGTYSFHVTAPPGVQFETGVRPIKGAAATYGGPVDTLEESSFAAFGALRVNRIGGDDVAAVVAPGVTLSDDEIIRWLKTELGVVADYLGHFPEDRARLFVAPGTSEVMRGKTLGGGGASVLLRVGTKVDRGNLLDDWVAAHELIHVGFPALDRDSAWFAEGLASYVEPVARARAGLISRDRFWTDLLDGVPQGLPGPGDDGLEGSTSIGRIYWGGTLFFLLADLRIRERTGNARSLQDAVRGVIDAAANVEQRWPLARVLDVADAATGTRVLHELYAEQGRTPARVDVTALWKRLGVQRTGGVISYDNAAPLGLVRRAITK